MSSVGVDSNSVLDDLVRQFSDPMAFFRELIQNSVDAGSGEVEIQLDYSPGASRDDGVMVARIDDFGEGMSREIIETKLTRLFSSSKDEDFTKIGRFGIGFVSVFAISPDAVCVDTGRGGECWRVLFRENKTFDLIALDGPVEGTQIQVIKGMSEAEAERFAQRTREVVSYWCKHVRVPIYIDGERINEAFDVESICKLSYEEEGTRIVAGIVPQQQALFGYYNRGLTLKETHAGLWPYVTMKIDSRYLEHTLTRDQVLEDRHYHKAERLMADVYQDLQAKLWADVERAAQRWPQEAERYDALCELLALHVAAAGAGAFKGHERAPLFVSLHQGPVSLSQCRQAQQDKGGGRLFIAASQSYLSQSLRESLLILALEQGHPMSKLLSEVLASAWLPVLESSFVLAAPSSAGALPGAQALCEEVRVASKAVGASLQWVGYGALGAHHSLGARLALLCEDRRVALPQDAVMSLGRSALCQAKELVLNSDDARVQDLIKVARREPEWAAFTLCKMLLLHQGLSLEDDSALAASCVERRMRRLGVEEGADGRS